MGRGASFVALAVAAALVPSPGRAAGCKEMRPQSTYEVPSSRILVACADAGCDVSVGGERIASVALGGNAAICTGTTMRTEDDLPASCAAEVAMSGFALVRNGPGGRAEAAFDVFEAPRSDGLSAPQVKRACVPVYAEKRGDVWQFTWSGVGRGFAFQAFEEDEAAPGRGNSSRTAEPRPFVSVVGGVVRRLPPSAPRKPARKAPRPRKPTEPEPPSTVDRTRSTPPVGTVERF